MSQCVQRPTPGRDRGGKGGWGGLAPGALTEADAHWQCRLCWASEVGSVHSPLASLAPDGWPSCSQTVLGPLSIPSRAAHLIWDVHWLTWVSVCPDPALITTYRGLTP